MVPFATRHERKGGSALRRGRSWGRGFARSLGLLLFLLSLCLPTSAVAHPANVPSARIKVAPDGTFTARVRFDVVAFATGATPRDADDRAMNALVDGLDEALAASLADAAGRFRRGFVTEPGSTIDRLEFPSVLVVRRFLASDPSPRLPAMLTALVWGHLPKGARTVAFRYPNLFDTVVQTVEFPYVEPISEPVDPGRVSSTLRIPTPEEIARTAATFAIPQKAGGGRRAESGTAPRRPVPPSQSLSVKVEKTIATPASATPKVVVPSVPKPSPAFLAPEPKSRPLAPSLLREPPRPPPSAVAPPPSINLLGAQVAIYLRMGFTHIVPQGLDHILFVLGLFLLGSNAKALLKQITAFTVAHSITLALTALGIIRLPGRIIEPVIAISIAFVAIENLFTREVRPWRTAVVFAFGLVHGMGFAEVFADAGLRGAGLLTALLSFNVGVELGQLSVVAMAFGVVGWFRKDPRYRSAVVIPASLAIATVALFWSVQRIAG